MGRQASVGVVTKDLNIHLSPLQTQCLLAKPEHLLRIEFTHQGGAITARVRTTLTTLIQQSRIKGQQTGQTTAQIRPVRIEDQTRFKKEGIRQSA